MFGCFGFGCNIGNVVVLLLYVLAVYCLLWFVMIGCCWAIWLTLCSCLGLLAWVGVVVFWFWLIVLVSCLPPLLWSLCFLIVCDFMVVCL